MAGIAPVVLQAHDGWSNAFFDAYNFWAGVNNQPYVPRVPPPRLTDASMMAEYTRTQGLAFTQEAAPVPPVIPVAGRPRGRLRRKGPVAFIPIADGPGPNAALLGPANRPRGYGPPANWVAVRLLGSGGQGAVVLWTYVGPVAPAPSQKKVAVKTASNPNRDLAEEGRLMGVVGASMSEHVTRLLIAPRTLTPLMRMTLGLAPAWDNMTRQLIMEYCPHMTLEALLAERIRRDMRLEEYTLWQIFECLIDGCCVLEYGMELVYDPLNRVAVVPASYNPAVNPMTVVHKDLKPNNAFIGSRSASHVNVPVCKIGDFGLAEEWPKVYVNNLWQASYAGNSGIFRRGGTRGYYTPESFHPGWNYTDYQSSPVCGKFGSHSNVYQIGAIMYMLACFDMSPPEAHLPYTPGHNIHGAPPLGRLYGTWLQVQPGLSNLLKDTIHECLYEMPANRASLLNLKTIIRTEINSMVLNPAISPEPIGDIEQPEPISACVQNISLPSPDTVLNDRVTLEYFCDGSLANQLDISAQAALPAFARVSRRCTAVMLRAGNPRCGNNVIVRANTVRPRCWLHWDVRQYPLA